MRPFGFFRAVTGEATDPPLPPPGVTRGDRRIVRYLMSGTVVFERLEMVPHPLVPGESLGPAVIATDGEWVWPLAIAGLVADGSVPVPSDLATHAASKEYRTPDLDIDAVRSVARWLEAERGWSMPPTQLDTEALDSLTSGDGDGR